MLRVGLISQTGKWGVSPLSETRTCTWLLFRVVVFNFVCVPVLRDSKGSGRGMSHARRKVSEKEEEDEREGRKERTKKRSQSKKEAMR